MTTDKEQRLESAIIKILRDEGISFRPSNTYSDVKDVAFEAIKSDAAREYWQSQKQETPELEEIRKEWDRRSAPYLKPICNVDAIWDFFAPYIKGTDAVKHNAIDVLKWLNWQKENTEDPIMLYDGGFYFMSDEEGDQELSEEEVIQIYEHYLKSLPKAPKEVPND